MCCHSVLARLPCDFVWGRGCADGESGVRSSTIRVPEGLLGEPCRRAAQLPTLC